MREALFWEKLQDNKVKCTLCPHNCIIKNNQYGICGVRYNKDGVLYTLVYDKIVAASIDPIEKKPLFHIKPGTTAFSIATVGCNLRCKNCQNYSISQYPIINKGKVEGDEVSPQEIVDAAISNGCESIAYTYTEPTIFFELAYDTAKISHEKGLMNLFITNGFINKEPLKKILPYLDGANVDLKSFSDNFYKKVAAGRLQPVLDTIELLYKSGKWVELTTLIIPGYNDSIDEIKEIARFIKSLSVNIPWHLSAFYPSYQMKNVPATNPDTVIKLREVALNEGLNFVYSGNIMHNDGENTVCSNCGKTVIERKGYRISSNNIENGKCKFCGFKIPGIFD